MNLENKATNIVDNSFIEDIIDSMSDPVRVLDKDCNLLYINRAMKRKFGDVTGKQCFAALGKSSPCQVCVSRDSVFDGHTHEKEEIVGESIYSVKSSPIKNSKNEVIAIVEVFRDITKIKKMQDHIISQNQKLQNELNIARKLQCSLLPKNITQEKIKFSFIYKPCRALGGDFIDIFQIDDKHLGVYIADVSGHGVPASMLTVFLSSNINKKKTSPAEALMELYTEFNLNYADQFHYITVFYAIINMEDMEITYSNAGHNCYPLLFNKDKVEFLRSPGIPISNWLEEPNYTEKKIKFNKGDKLFLYTDGIVEVKNPEGQQFGEERILDALLSSKEEPDVLMNEMIATALKFAKIENQNNIPDDITMALLEIK